MSDQGLLPHWEIAFIDLRKLSDYALDPKHSVGGHKARVMASALGYSWKDAEPLAIEIRRGLSVSPAILRRADGYGVRYRVDMHIVGPAGAAIVRTGWIIREDTVFPRLLTAYVK